MLDIAGWATQLLAGNNTVSGQRLWEQGTKSGLGKADTTQVDRYLAGRSPGASETQKRDCLTAKEEYTGGGELSGEGVCHSL